jgi:hypothetical protein
MATINPFQGPIDYSINVQSPFEAAIGGFKLGAAGAEAQAQTRAREQAAKTQTGIDAFFAKPAAERNYSDIEPLLLGANKQQFDALQTVAKNMGEQKLESSKRFTGQLLVALEQNPETAKTLLSQRIEAETDPQQKLAFQDTLKTIDISPKKAADTIELLGAATFGKDWYQSITDVRRSRETAAEAPSKLSEQVAKASKAVTDAQIAVDTAPTEVARLKAVSALEVVKADFARANAVLDVQQKGATLRKTESDIIIDRENARIAALNAASAKETNVLKRAELQQKIDEATEKRDQTNREQLATLANQTADIDNFINTAVRIKQTPRNIIEAATGPIASRLPTTNKDVSDFEALVETLSSQAFVSQIPKIKGTGALNQSEGEKLQASLQNLSLKQSPDRLIENVNEAVRLLEKARVTIAVRAGTAAPPSDVPARNEVFVALPNGTRAKFPNQAAADAYKKAAGIK